MGMGMGMGMQQGSGRVEEVEWQAENVNSVTLIGRLGSEPEIKYLEDGKVIASASIAVNKGKNVAPSWFELSFWNETARVSTKGIHTVKWSVNTKTKANKSLSKRCLRLIFFFFDPTTPGCFGDFA